MPMNIPTALLPHKHVRFSESIVGVAGLVRRQLEQPRTIDELWAIVESEGSLWPTQPSFTQLILAVDLLFAIKQVRGAPDGRVSAVGNEEGAE
jgi:hypothetical protein